MVLPRKSIGLRTKLAATLCALTDARGERIISHDHARQLSEEQVLSLFQFDHYPIPHEGGGPDAHWNLDPRLIADHRIKSATIDTPRAAKIKRIAKAIQAHSAAMLHKATGAPPAPEKRSRLQGRGFAKGPRPLRSRNVFHGNSGDKP